MRKIYLTHILPFLIALTILIGTKNLGILKTLIKTQFHYTNLSLTNSKPWTNWQVFHSMDWTWMWMWPRSPILWFSSHPRIYVDSGTLPNLDQFSEPTFIPVPIELEIESPILDSHIPLMEKECEFQFLDLDWTLELKLTLGPKVDFFRVSIGSRTYHSWAQVNHSIKSHSFVGHK